MIHPYVAAAAIAMIGGIVAISAREARVVAVGLLLAMCAAQLATSPEPAVIVIVFRVLGSLLAAYLLWAAARSRSTEAEGSGIGILAECAVAAAAFSAGWFVAPVKPLSGPLVAQAAGVALIAISIVPLTGRDVLRLGAGATILVLGGSMLLAAWVGQPSSLWQASLTALLVGLVGATSLLISPITGEAAALPVTAGEDTANGVRAIEPGIGTEPDAEAPVAPVVIAAPAARRGGRKPKAAVDVAADLPDVGAAPAEAEAAAVIAEPIPDAIAPTRTRVSRIRDSATRSLRGGAPGELPAGPAGSAQPGTTPADGYEQAVPPSNRVRRLRPREPRK
jgi:hypothetical protein